MNDTLNTIAKRYSCRGYTDDMPPDAQLDAIAQAAIQAPSGMNLQPWQIIVVKDKQLIADMEAEGMRVLAAMDDQAFYERIQARGGRLFYNAPCMIVVAIKPPDPNGSELIDCGIVTQNIMLAATSLGIDNVCCGFVGIAFTEQKAAAFSERLQFPKGYIYGMSVLLGYGTEPGAPHVTDPSKITLVE